jgi:hypothetical protein
MPPGLLQKMTELAKQFIAPPSVTPYFTSGQARKDIQLLSSGKNK